MELQVIPRFSVCPVPDIAVIPLDAATDPKAGREIRVTVTSGAKGKSSGTAALLLPAGWIASPSSAPIEFAHNKFEFNEAQYGPLPAKVSSNRVTDENAPVQVLAPDDPILTYPNRIGEVAWRGWVQERGLYFLSEKDPAYIDLVQLEDPFPSNKGAKRGALVEARVGKGRWIHVGLGLWR